MGRKQNFYISLSLLPSSFAFPGLRFGRKCRFRILGLDLGESVGGKRKISMQDDFLVNVICFFGGCTESCHILLSKSGQYLDKDHCSQQHQIKYSHSLIIKLLPVWSRMVHCLCHIPPTEVHELQYILIFWWNYRDYRAFTNQVGKYKESFEIQWDPILQPPR